MGIPHIATVLQTLERIENEQRGPAFTLAETIERAQRERDGRLAFERVDALGDDERPHSPCGSCGRGWSFAGGDCLVCRRQRSGEA